MDLSDFKRYSAKVGGGSGVLFQPMNNIEYTYILTANHNLHDSQSKDLLDKIDIYIPNIYDTTPHDFKIREGENYFPHQIVDIAILKVDYLDGFESIFTNHDFKELKNSFVCGYPSYGKNDIQREFTNYEIKRFVDETDTYCKAQLTGETKGQDEIIGLSGGGIMKIENEYISLIGIQIEVFSSVTPIGQIEFVPIKHFNDIINYPNNEGRLSELLPPYMGHFKFLNDDAFNISAGIEDDDIKFTVSYLKSKANKVLQSDITPIYIKEYFKDRLLLNKNDLSKLNNKLIYLTWLEFLAIINIAKAKDHCCENLEDIFNELRLIYRDTNSQWQDTDFLRECGESDYPNLKNGGTVLIKTNRLPAKAKIEHYWIEKKSVVPRIDNLRNNFNKNAEFNIDNASSEFKEFAFDKYNFVHFEYIKEFLIVSKSEDYALFKNSNIEELKEKLKIEYGKLFGL